MTTAGPVEGLRSGTVVRVLHGAATDDEAVAVLLALDRATATDPAAQPPVPPSGWRLAARLEGLVTERLAAPRDLHAARRRVTMRP